MTDVGDESSELDPTQGATARAMESRATDLSPDEAAAGKRSVVREEIKNPARSAEQAGDESHDPTMNHPMVREEAASSGRTYERRSVEDEESQPANGSSGKPGPFQRLKNWATAIVMPRTQVDVLGDRGENVAAKHLRNLGYKIIERNFRCPTGEIDIIARDGKTLVFVEVKTRVYEDQDVTPEDQVNNSKRHQITKAAKFYLTRYGWPQPPARFDVVAIVWPTGREPMIRHTESAFEASF